MFIRKIHNKALKGTKLLVALTALAYNRVSRLESERELRQKYLDKKCLKSVKSVLVFSVESAG